MTKQKWANYARQHSPLLLQCMTTNVVESWHASLKKHADGEIRFRHRAWFVIIICMVGKAHLVTFSLKGTASHVKKEWKMAMTVHQMIEKSNDRIAQRIRVVDAAVKASAMSYIPPKDKESSVRNILQFSPPNTSFRIPRLFNKFSSNTSLWKLRPSRLKSSPGKSCKEHQHVVINDMILTWFWHNLENPPVAFKVYNNNNGRFVRTAPISPRGNNVSCQ